MQRMAMVRHKRSRKRQIRPDQDGDDFSLTSPIQITVTRTITPETIATPATTRAIPPSSAPLPSQPTTPVLSPPSASSIVPEITSTPITVTSPPTPSVVLSSTLNTASDSSASASGTNAPSGGAARTSLPTGAVVGIVIAVVLIVLAATVFFVRTRYMRNRQAKRAGTSSAWFGEKGQIIASGGSGGGGGGSTDAVTSSFFPTAAERYSTTTGPTTSPGVTFAKAQSDALAESQQYPLPVPVPPPPPMSYNNPPPPISPSTTSPGATRGSNTDAIVKFTFIPTLPDELPISNMEKIKILQEYDDGWALCLSGKGQQGMVPLECLDRGSPENRMVANADQLGVKEYDRRNSRRDSSLNVLPGGRR